MEKHGGNKQSQATSAVAVATKKVGPTFVEGNQGATAGRTEPQPPLAQIIADMSPRSQQKLFARLILSALALKTPEANPPSAVSSQPAPLADSKALPPTTRWDSSRLVNDCPPKPPMEDDDSKDSSLNVVDKAPRSPHRTPQAKTPSKVASSQPASKALPSKTLLSVSLAGTRWDSSRSLNDCPPKPPAEEEDYIDCSRNVGDKAPRSPRKTPKAKPPSKASSQTASTGVDKALPPKTVYRSASLADARWDSSRHTLSEIDPMTPRSSRKTLSEKAASARSQKTSGISPPSTLAETRWDSSRSLTDNAPKSPRKKKQKEDSHLRALHIRQQERCAR
jgi:hypothetical protein